MIVNFITVVTGGGPGCKIPPKQFSPHDTIGGIKAWVTFSAPSLPQGLTIFRVSFKGHTLDDDLRLSSLSSLVALRVPRVSVELTVELWLRDVTVPDWATDLLKEASDLRSELRISDVTSDGPRAGKVQWVNLVMQGGGVLGIAHVGFVAALEEAGVRFMGLGGTSAGAINAAVMAAVRQSLQDRSWVDAQYRLQGCPLATFEDGPGVCKSLRKGLGARRGILDTLFKAVALRYKKLRQAWDNLGAHPGDTFHRWLVDLFGDAGYGVPTKRDIEDRLQLPQGLVFTAGGQPVPAGKLKPSLKLVAAELMTQSMVVFPRDANLFYPYPHLAKVADFVRASMSVPLFFRPFKLPMGYGSLPLAGQPSSNWLKVNGFTGNVPDQAVFCDGGILSNFPTSQFHKKRWIDMGGGQRFMLPTIGSQLGPGRNHTPTINSPITLLRAMNNTSAHLHDWQFLHAHPEYAHLVAAINTSGFNWLDFDLTDSAKQDLLKAGMRVGIDFLKTWVVRPAKAQRVLLVDLLGQTRAVPVRDTDPPTFDPQLLGEADLEGVPAHELQDAIDSFALTGPLDLSVFADRQAYITAVSDPMRQCQAVHPYTYALVGGKWEVFKHIAG